MRRILIDVHPNSTKVCIVNNGLLEEFWVERKNLSRLVGNVYKGKVENVLPGMQAAFVNIMRATSSSTASRSARTRRSTFARATRCCVRSRRTSSATRARAFR